MSRVAFPPARDRGGPHDGLVDDEQRWRAVQGRDPRFDGVFVLGVISTGIYCRPSCPARTPLRHHARFHLSAAAAQASGLRACKRCRPDATPGTPTWDGRSDLAARAARLISDGVVDREGVDGLSIRLGYSRRQIERALLAEPGAGPLALARAQRAQTARTLIETTDLPLTDIAYAAG
ncbi:MAG: methylphosphotriester-DNA--protein-cysteine methyltransferase family protein, partial [Frankiales bacterium]|nr:methylphosphotriester-DNA--protein-cysteine methyltransferase family protein [Frankiales bacterium]